MYCNSEEEEYYQIEQASRGNQEAMIQLCEKHIRIITLLANRCVYDDYDLKEDLIQSGYLGLSQAVRRFDRTLGNKFITYAVPWILGEMKKALRHNSRAHETVSLESLHTYSSDVSAQRLRGAEQIDLRILDLNLALQSLSEEERFLILLRYYRDKTQKETADLMHKSQSQISKIEQRALTRLQFMLK